MQPVNDLKAQREKLEKAVQSGDKAGVPVETVWEVRTICPDPFQTCIGVQALATLLAEAGTSVDQYKNAVKALKKHTVPWPISNPAQLQACRGTACLK